MKIIVESTTQLSDIIKRSHSGDPVSFPARVWEGTTEDGIPVAIFVTRIVPLIDRDDPRHAEFGKQLTEVRAPTAPPAAIPLRMIL